MASMDIVCYIYNNYIINYCILLELPWNITVAHFLVCFDNHLMYIICICVTAFLIKCLPTLQIGHLLSVRF